MKIYVKYLEFSQYPYNIPLFHNKLKIPFYIICFLKYPRSDFFRVFGNFGTLLNESNDHGRIDGHNVQIVFLHKIPSNLLYNFFRYCALMHERGTFMSITTYLNNLVRCNCDRKIESNSQTT
jgi:hypothetical protein